MPPGTLTEDHIDIRIILVDTLVISQKIIQRLRVPYSVCLTTEVESETLKDVAKQVRWKSLLHGAID